VNDEIVPNLKEHKVEGFRQVFRRVLLVESTLKNPLKLYSKSH